MAAPGMQEAAFASLAFEDVVILPKTREVVAARAEFVDEAHQRRIVEAVAAIGAEFGRNAARTDFPVKE
jgi:hypothetical protein